jgi:ASC-1-like (ASCH) protein
MPKIIDLPIYMQYFKFIESGRKTIEVRVGYSFIRNIQVGDHIRFKSRNLTCEVEVVRKTEYPSAAILMEKEDSAKVNHTRTQEQQIHDINSIYPPQKQKLGVFAIEFKPTV